jgi:hypothetical protein
VQSQDVRKNPRYPDHMITLEDCVALCGLEEDEICAISEHEHCPEIAAAALASHLLNSTGGAAQIRAMIIDDIRTALREGRAKHASELFAALRHFSETHPDLDPEPEATERRLRQ